MKLNPTLLTAKAVVSLSICIGIQATQPVFASGKPYMNFTSFNNSTGEDELENINKEKNKSIYYLRNNNSVKIYLDAPKKKVHVIAKRK